MRLGERYGVDRRMIGLMVVHGAAAGNFSPLNVLSAIVVQAVDKSGVTAVGTSITGDRAETRRLEDRASSFHRPGR
jgi:hypothetical protein